MKNETNVSLSVYFWVILMTFSLYMLLLGMAIFYNSEIAFVFTIVVPFLIIVNVVLGITMIIERIFNGNYINLKKLPILLPWIIVIIFIFPFVISGLFNYGPKLGIYIDTLFLVVDIALFVYLVLYFFKYIYGNNLNIQVK